MSVELVYTDLDGTLNNGLDYLEKLTGKNIGRMHAIKKEFGDKVIQEIKMTPKDNFSGFLYKLDDHFEEFCKKGLQLLKGQHESILLTNSYKPNHEIIKQVNGSKQTVIVTVSDERVAENFAKRYLKKYIV